MYNYVCTYRFVSEQLKRISLGDDKKEAGRRAMWTLRSEGIDIRVTQVCVHLLQYVSVIAYGPQVETPRTTTRDSGSSKRKVPSTLASLRGLLEQMHSRK